MKQFFLLALLLILTHNTSHAQNVVPIDRFSTDINGKAQIEITSSSDKYYLLQIRQNLSSSFETITSMTQGLDGKTIITESLSALPEDHYQVLEFDISSPQDTDNDGVDDMVEYLGFPRLSPLNGAKPIDFINGAVGVESLTNFKELSVVEEDIFWAPFLNDQVFVKFVITDSNSDNPKLYFVNSQTHYIHQEFMDAVGIDVFNDDVLTGEIVYYPTTVASNGTLGVFAFNYSFGFGEAFNRVQMTHELIATNMPFLKNNLSYFVAGFYDYSLEDDKELFDNSRIPILREEDVFADIDYLALHVAEGYGFFKLMDLDETPSSRDVVLYESLPNTLPRVGGIMTSFIQTPLSHVNLRAIQDNLPNAFIRNPLQVDSIANLLNKYVYYRVDQDKYFIREATLEEVNEWFEDIRPDKEQVPELNLSQTSILPLDEIEFGMSDAFGAKCTNVATMRNFGFPEGTIPNGFGVPFYFYQEFMKYNGFFDRIEEILADNEFHSNLEYRIDVLKDLRSDIKKADMPQWMLDELQEMHDQFPEGISVRCRSSTNNEDLPGFSGAGLYTSKTQHPHEGHISKSIKQVFASMWNFRAYDERDFYRVDQYKASMGVLCHPNFKEELANGVGVSTDPIYQTDNTFYLNTQVGEELVTNPNAMTIPEEILLDRISVTEDDYIVIRESNLVVGDELIMTENYLDEMRDYLGTIHDEFQILYEAEESETFAMDIEYKITSTGQLSIKQARPWASFWSESDIISTSQNDQLIEMKFYPNPVREQLNIYCDCYNLNVILSSLTGQKVFEKTIDNSNIQIPMKALQKGMYILTGINREGKIVFSRKILKE